MYSGDASLYRVPPRVVVGPRHADELDAVLAVDADAGLAVVQPGVVHAVLQGQPRAVERRTGQRGTGHRVRPGQRPRRRPKSPLGATAAAVSESGAVSSLTVGM